MHLAEVKRTWFLIWMYNTPAFRADSCFFSLRLWSNINRKKVSLIMFGFIIPTFTRVGIKILITVKYCNAKSNVYVDVYKWRIVTCVWVGIQVGCSPSRVSGPTRKWTQFNVSLCSLKFIIFNVTQWSQRNSFVTTLHCEFCEIWIWYNLCVHDVQDHSSGLIYYYYYTTICYLVSAEWKEDLQLPSHQASLEV